MLRRSHILTLRRSSSLLVLIVMAAMTGLAVGQSAESTEPEPTTTDSPAILEALVSARFEALNPRPLTGQAFSIELVIGLPRGLELVDVPPFDDPWGDFELRSVSPLESEAQADGSRLYRQELQVVLWQPRDYVTPETFIGYRQTGFASVLRLPVTAANITVPTVLDFEDLTLRPYKPLIYLLYVSPWVIVLGVGLTAALGVLIARLWQRRPRRAMTMSPPPTPGELALRTLDALTTSVALPKVQIIEAADVLRVYLNARLDVGLLERVTTIDALQNRLPRTIRIELDGLLEQADLLKFSGSSATEADAHHYMGRCQQWLRTVEDTLTVTGADSLSSADDIGAIK